MSELGALTRAYPGWSLNETRALSVRERRHWIKYAVWRHEVGG